MLDIDDVVSMISPAVQNSSPALARNRRAEKFLESRRKVRLVGQPRQTVSSETASSQDPDVSSEKRKEKVRNEEIPSSDADRAARDRHARRRLQEGRGHV